MRPILRSSASLSPRPLRRINLTPRTPKRLSSTTQSTAPSTSPPQPEPKQKRFTFATIVIGAISVTIGLTAGESLRRFLRPPWYPDPGTPEDAALLAQLTKDIDGLEVVTKLRAKSHEVQVHADGQVPPEVSAWREILVDNIAEVERGVTGGGDGADAKARAEIAGSKNMPVLGREIPAERTFTQATLRGAGLLGVQRVFWNSQTRELVAVVWFGSNMSGWPNLTHGGAIATALEEGLARAVVGPDESLESIQPALSLALQYKAPTQANNYYVLRASLLPSKDLSESAEPVPQAPRSSWFSFLSRIPNVVSSASSRQIEVSATLERLDGKVCAKANATWPADAVKHVVIGV